MSENKPDQWELLREQLGSHGPIPAGAVYTRYKKHSDWAEYKYPGNSTMIDMIDTITVESIEANPSWFRKVSAGTGGGAGIMRWFFNKVEPVEKEVEEEVEVEVEDRSCIWGKHFAAVWCKNKYEDDGWQVYDIENLLKVDGVHTWEVDSRETAIDMVQQFDEYFDEYKSRSEANSIQA